jgi:hypothetical protein
MKKLLTLTLLVTFATTLLAHNDRDKRKTVSGTCTDCATTEVPPCADCNTPEPAACADCTPAAALAPCTDCAPAVAPAQAMSRLEARTHWQAMSKEERRQAKNTLRDLLTASPVGMAVATLSTKLQQLKQHGNNTADAQMMMMDEIVRILIIVALVLLCLVLLFRII